MLTCYSLYTLPFWISSQLIAVRFVKKKCAEWSLSWHVSSSDRCMSCIKLMRNLAWMVLTCFHSHLFSSKSFCGDTRGCSPDLVSVPQGMFQPWGSRSHSGALPTLRDLNDFFWGIVCYPSCSGQIHSLVRTLDDLGTTQHCGKGT